MCFCHCFSANVKDIYFCRWRCIPDTLAIIITSILESVKQSCGQGSYGQGKSGNFEGVREKSGKTERVGEKSGNFKIPLTRPIIYALFSQFLSASGALPPDPHRGSAPVNTAG